MKVIYGPGHNQLKILNDAGEDLTETLHISSIRFEVVASAGQMPLLELECEVFGRDQIELDLKADKIRAVLRDNGITRIERQTQDNADIHPDA